MNTTGRLEVVQKNDENWSSILAMDKTLFPRPWKAEEWHSLDLNHHLLYAWILENKLAGFALFSAPQGDETAHLLKILVETSFRGSGEAVLFWENIRQKLRGARFSSVYLEVEESNSRAQSFYRKQGFSLLRRVKSYYSDGADAVMMQLTL